MAFDFCFNLFHSNKVVVLVSIDCLSLPFLRTLKMWIILISFSVSLEATINGKESGYGLVGPLLLDVLF